MMGLSLGLVIELLLAVLLLLTIGYCVVLNSRLKRLRADELSLRATISELVTATEIAERAILSLKATAGDADKVIGQRLRDAEHVTDDLSRLIEAAERLKLRPVVPPVAEPVRAPVAPVPVAAMMPEPPQPRAAAPATTFRPGFGARPAFAARGG